MITYFGIAGFTSPGLAGGGGLGRLGGGAGLLLILADNGLPPPGLK